MTAESSIAARIAELERRLADLKARLPAHTIPPGMIAEMDELEDQMCSMLPEGNVDLVDRADALVWAFTELMLKPQRKWGAA